MADRVRVYEVGPRDGLQNERGIIPVDRKVALINALADAGLADIEVGSFVSPRWVPQMADTAEVLAALSYEGGQNFAVLVPNMKGWAGYLDATVNLPRAPGEVAVFVSASEGFSRANLNCSIDESLERIAPVVAAARAAGVTVRGYVSCVTDCPFEGAVAPDAVARVVAALGALAPMQVSLGDTIGKGRPETVTRMLDAVVKVAPAASLAGHFHDTGGWALANVDAALKAGIRCFDAAVGGLGGCPYAPGAPGNLATESLVARLEEMGLSTGIDRKALARAGDLAREMRGSQ